MRLFFLYCTSPMMSNYMVRKPPSIDDCVFLRGGAKDAPRATWDRSALYFHVPSRVKLVGDSAYDSQPDKVTPTLGSHAPETKKLFARMKSMQETFFKRCKDFNVLTDGFRHGTCTEDKLAKIKMAFESVAVLLAYEFENGHPLFEARLHKILFLILLHWSFSLSIYTRCLLLLRSRSSRYRFIP